MEENINKLHFLIASNFVIHPQISIFLVFTTASLSPYWLQIKFSMSLFFYLFTFVINLQHQKFVTTVSVNNQHGIQWQGQALGKKFVFEWVHSRGPTTAAGDSRVHCTRPVATKQPGLKPGRLTSDKVTGSLKVGTFLRHSVYICSQLLT